MKNDVNKIAIKNPSDDGEKNENLLLVYNYLISCKDFHMQGKGHIVYNMSFN